MATAISSLSFSPLLAHYDFSGVSSTIVPDLTGNGYTGVIRGCDRGGANVSTDSVFGQSFHVLLLSGGESGGFLQLPDGILGNADGFTISFYCRLCPVTEYTCVLSFGTDYCFYLSAMPDPDSEDRILLSPCATAGGRSQETALEHWVSVASNQWFHAAVTFGAGIPAPGHLYIDGRLCGSFSHRRMDSHALDHCTDCFFGSGTFSAAPAAAAFTDIRIFGGVLDEQGISSLFSIEPQTRLHMEAQALALLFEQPLEVPPVLPAQGQYGAEISWKSLTPEIISDQGQFVRPEAGRPCAEGVLEASLSFEESRMTLPFRCRILPLPSDGEIARRDAEQVSIPFPGHIAQDLQLPASGSLGSSFCWHSSRPELMDHDGRILKRPDHKPAELKLTLTASYKSACVTRDFSLIILPDCCRSLPQREYIPGAPSPVKPPVLLAQPAAMEQIDLTDRGILYDNRQRCLDYLLLLDPDRMLYNFRKAFGFSTRNALPPGGWEEPSGLLRGHSTGHYLSALAHAFASTKDSRYREKADYIIREFLSLQETAQGDPAAFRTDCTPSNAVQSLWSKSPDTWGEGFLSAYSPDQFALLEQFTPYATIWAPYYTLHKILAGLLDCHRLLHSKDALLCACRIGDWVCRRLSATTHKQRARMWKMYIAGEYGGMNESLARLYALTGKSDYLEAAQMFDNPALFEGLVHGRDTLSGIHANQHIPQIIGALEEFRATGDLHYYCLARNFWELTVNRYMYSIGGVGRGENFREADILANNIEGSRNCETCATYNLLKLTGMLYQYAPDHSPYMDYYERALLNHIAASQNPKVTHSAHHGVTYMLPIGPGARKEYSNDYDDFTCCHGTGMENHVRYTEHIYHHGKDGSLYVNLFLPSVYHWEEKGIRIALEGAVCSQSFCLTVSADEAGNPVPLKLRIRIPYWCRDTFRIQLNDEAPFAPDPAAGYCTIDRTFGDGDRITVYTPYTLHLCYTNDAYEGYPAASLMYGPLVMTALCEKTDWLTLNLPPVLEDAFEIRWDPMPVLRYDDLVFVPSYAAHNRPYHTYFKINLT